MSAILLIQLIACAFMTGLIWTIQLLHYPAFAMIDQKQFLDFHARHSRVITWIVAPVMTLELGTAIWLLAHRFESHWIQLNLILLVLIWIGTAFLSVPLHQSLSDKWDLSKIQKLVFTNWLRTGLWTFRLLMLGLVSLSTV